MKNNYIKSLMVSAVALAVTPAYVQAQEHNEYWYQKVSLFDMLPIQSDDIVMLGNSITDGAEWSEIFNDHHVKNRGISADVIDGVRQRLYQVTDGKPSKIFLLIGINDISHDLPPSEIALRYENLLSDIRMSSPGSELYVLSVMPIDNSFGRYRNLKGKEHRIPELNNLLEPLAVSHDAVWIDTWPCLADSNGSLKKEFTNDGLHLTGEAYKALANLLRPYIYDNSNIKQK